MPKERKHAYPHFDFDIHREEGAAGTPKFYSSVLVKKLFGLDGPQTVVSSQLASPG